MVTRIDAFAKVTGRAIYAEDVYIDGMLYAVPLHAPHPRAKLTFVDYSRAKTSSGVVGIITADDVTGDNKTGGIIKDHRIFVKDVTRYHGDVIAMIAAESLEAAYEARDKICLKFEPLKTLFSPEEALRPDAPIIHPERGSNICCHYSVRHGDAEKWFKSGEKTCPERSRAVVQREYRTQHVEHAYMEPEGCVAVANNDDSVTVRGGMQHPFTAQRFTARATGLSLNKVQIIQTTLGGGFGGKDDTISIICARAAIIALKLKRPVKIIYTREESVRESYKRHPFHVTFKGGVQNDGKLQALEVKITADAGAYCSTSPFVIWRPTVQCTGPYIYPNVKCNSDAVYTNNTFTGAMRGFGSPQMNFAIESFMDEMAAELKMDPIELRRRNFFTQDCTTHTGQKLDNHKVSIAEVVDICLKKIGWSEKFAKCSHGKPDEDENYYGIGICCSYRGVSLGHEGKDTCSAIIKVTPDALVELEVGVAENGQGLKTVMARICAEELKIPIDRIIYKDVDTLSVPDSCPTVASRGTLVGGNAVIDACRQIKEKLRPFADMGFEGAVSACHSMNIQLHALGVWNGPPVSWTEETGQGNAYFTYVYGCQAVELVVEGKTGKVRVRKMVGVHDMGKAINPEMARGQIYGGMVMGMGFALKEEIIHKEGVIENLNFDKYKIVTSGETPEMEAVIVENTDPAGPWGAKALGEPVNELMGGAIANAIYYATGVRFRELPITAEKIIKAMANAK
ncbi:MAG: dehydrogenase [Deltaproteobacteria bacterium CG11_big_fil_rev_8_21_14_0_20_49_13]|nr:MAG: dehydrogenase [Deltaproteobacteria bacterium CG11_big_fil_rev_8_21_14_0_20_49_13]